MNVWRHVFPSFFFVFLSPLHSFFDMKEIQCTSEQAIVSFSSVLEQYTITNNTWGWTPFLDQFDLLPLIFEAVCRFNLYNVYQSTDLKFSLSRFPSSQYLTNLAFIILPSCPLSTSPPLKQPPRTNPLNPSPYPSNLNCPSLYKPHNPPQQTPPSHSNIPSPAVPAHSSLHTHSPPLRDRRCWALSQLLQDNLDT